ncbi:hypothetical protein REH65_12550 [Saccharopolyspora sp. ID03-671]|uniref:Uncharacterized protein n=1 Tax=Prauserella isguenensis TaxID=1470180 RepID=A0A839S6C9_9PSEU|nr:hypothetical protein [Prauserella isguenensis]MBB3053336.1 hypothetical protein [Prauserella isguenensis]
MAMTQQYLAGELSLRLAQLQTLAADETSLRRVASLRHHAETDPLTELASIANRAIDLADVLCWSSVTRGDVASFNREAAVSAELYEFSVCAGLLTEG